MTPLPSGDATFFGILLESIFYGVYCVVFSVFIWTDGTKVAAKPFLFYPICVLFILITMYLALDFIAGYFTFVQPGGAGLLDWYLKIITSAIESFVDFISQLIVIYRCWYMWNRSKIMIIPVILSLASLAGSLALVGEISALLNTRNLNHLPAWWVPMGVTAFSLSLGVNAIVTGLLVLKIILECRQTKSANHLNWRKNIVPIIAILIETGLMTFVGQLAWTISYGLGSNVFGLVAGIVVMLYGLSPTIISVRAALGRSYEPSGVKSPMHFTNHTAHSKDIDDPGNQLSSVTVTVIEV